MLSARRNTTVFFTVLLIIGFGYFFWLMIKITLEYIPIDPNVSFLMIKQTEVTARPEYLSFFYTHVYTSIFVLLSGFLAILRKDFGIRNFHRNMGKVYIFLILIFAAPSGIYMGVFANGGIISKISFVILGILWWFSTLKAYRLARQKNLSSISSGCGGVLLLHYLQSHCECGKLLLYIYFIPILWMSTRSSHGWAGFPISF